MSFFIGSPSISTFTVILSYVPLFMSVNLFHCMSWSDPVMLRKTEAVA
ncbi:hypothetical protein QY97_03149 [Bacillus thermotolerans]|uniref:Uncharacterized protein n=1 Tax=Bacillus thermotolerans TaxID=1221996 RepID=A0A0F5HK75_BACTR|nr:hypothetical protein QY97_03149 [Bacillus thermotolerans]KKB41621.1 hypothetical protein QY95_00623 [Bacillus thermotolerans]